MKRLFPGIGFLFFVLIIVPGNHLMALGDKERSLWFDPSRHVRATNGAISVVVEKLTGRYYIETSKSLPLLFTRNNGATSFTNVHIDGKTFTNNTLNGPQTPGNTIAMPMGAAAVQNNSVVFSTDIQTRYGIVKLSQQFVPSLDQDYAFVRINTTVKNETNASLPIGTLLMMDLMMGFSDYVSVKVNDTTLTLERGYSGFLVPNEWYGSSFLFPTQIKARVRGEGTTAPDQFVVGRWQYDGYLGAASWDYIPSGLRFGDNAVLMQWNDRILRPGESTTVITDYGYLTNYALQLNCSVDAVLFVEDINGYQPNPFTFTSTVMNTGDVEISNVILKLDSLPNGISLASGESLQKSIASPIVASSSVSVTWKLIASEFQNDTRVPFTVRLISPAKIADSCSTSTIIPFFPKYLATLDCGVAIILQLNPSGSDYRNNPFKITATIQNMGNAPLDSLVASLDLPSGLQLTGGTLVQTVLPNPLLPSQSTNVTWNILATPDTAFRQVEFTISLKGKHKISLQCRQKVTLPSVTKGCTESVMNTKGKEFWFAFPPNEHGNTADTALLFISADVSTRVTIDRPGIPASSTITVLPKTVGTFFLEEQLNRADTGRVENLGVHITTDQPVAITFANLRRAHSDATMILPTHALGKSYIAVGYNYTDAVEHFIVCATENNTRVTIIPSSLTIDGKTPGVPFDVMMDQGQSYYVLSGLGGKFGGLTGSLITSDKPIAIIGGAATGHIPYPSAVIDYGYLNPHFDQYIPIEYLGKEYIAVPFRSRRNGDTYKFVATENSTTFTIDNGVPISLTQCGDAYETILERASFIKSDKPILIAQFANSAEYDYDSSDYADGSMVLLIPTNRFLKCHTFTTGLGEITEGTKLIRRFDSTFVNLIVPDGAQASIFLDGTVLPDTTFHLVPTSSFRYAQVLLKTGTHAIETSDQRGIGATVYGFGWHDAFTFNTGFALGVRLLDSDTLSLVRRSSIILNQNYPNPFNPTTTISFVISSATTGDIIPVQLTIHDMLGRELERLIETKLAEGFYSVSWDAGKYPSGKYTYRLRRGTDVIVRTMMLLK